MAVPLPCTTALCRQVWREPGQTSDPTAYGLSGIRADPSGDRRPCRLATSHHRLEQIRVAWCARALVYQWPCSRWDDFLRRPVFCCSWVAAKRRGEHGSRLLVTGDAFGSDPFEVNAVNADDGGIAPLG